MTKRRSTKSALLSSVLALFLCITMLMGTTFAWFTDSVTSANNIIQSGNLDIELYYRNSETNDWVAVDADTNIFKTDTLWEPGHTEVITLKVVNAGSLALKYQLGINVADETGSINQLNQPFKLSDYILFGIVDPAPATNYATREEAIAAVESGAKEINKGYLKASSINAGADDHIITLVIYMPDAIGNEANAKTGEAVPTIKLGLNLLATQMTAESDAFGTDYDEGAWAVGMKVYTAQDLQAAIDAGETNIVLQDNITLTEGLVIPATANTFAMRATPTPITIDLNGKNLMIETAYDDANAMASSAIVNNGSLVLTGEGTVKATNNYTIRNYGIMSIDGITVENGTMNFGDLTVESGTISNSRNGKHAIYNNGATLTVNGGAFHNGNPGNATIFAYGGEVTLNGGKYTIADGTATLGWTSCLIDAQGNAKYTVTGGTYEGTFRDYNNNTTITGGTFTSAPNSAFIPDGYELKDNGDGTFLVRSGPVASIGNTSYYTIEEAIANWTANTTLTLLKDVTLSDVITLKSTEHHILNLSTCTMTAATGKNAIQITPEGAGRAAKSCLTINADATNPGGITATGRSCIYYRKTNGIDDRLMVTINGGIYNASSVISSSSNNGGQACPYYVFNGGTFNGSVSLTKAMLKVTGGTFNGMFSCTGDSTAYRLITGGTFKSFTFMTADASNKFVIGSAKGVYDIGLYVNDNGYLVVGGPVITEPGDRFVASSANYSGWSSYLNYSSAATNGLYYTSVAEALADNNKASGKVTIYTDTVDLTGSTFKGTMEISDTLTVTFAEGTTPTWTVASAIADKTVSYTDTVADGIVTRVYTIG